MKNIGNKLKEAQKLQSRMTEMQAKLAELECEGAAGAGLVTVTLNGKGEMRRIKIDPSLLVPDDVEILEDLIVAAVSDAKSRIDQQTQSEMQKVAGGLSLPPGLKLPF